MFRVKICGLKTPEMVAQACAAGAGFVGFVFYPPSVRYVEPEQAYALVQKVPAGVSSVGLFVNPTDRDLETVLGRAPMDMLQLHGEESAARVAEMRVKFELPVMKAVAIATPQDADQIGAYEDAADWLLFDTKAPAGEYGGTGKNFDWNLLSGKKFKKPWMLSGGLNSVNIEGALKVLKPDAVDVSSGVERVRGEKDPALMREFIEKVVSISS
jgi:phosphoribosylanthranilate isomerase